jgi:hypothetical protein
MPSNPHDTAESDISAMLYLQGARKPPSHYLGLSLPFCTCDTTERACTGVLYLWGARKPLGMYPMLSM